MGAWGTGLWESDDATEGLDKFITNVQKRGRPITDVNTLKRVFEETLTQLNHGKKANLEDVCEDSRFSEAVLAIGEHLRLYGVTVAGPLRVWMEFAMKAEVDRIHTYHNSRKRRGVLNQFALRINL